MIRVNTNPTIVIESKASIDSLGIEAAGPLEKLKIKRWVCAPQYLSAGTMTSPIMSLSSLN